MDSLVRTCEIVEVKDEQSLCKGWGSEKKKPPLVKKKGCNKSFEDDINKLFESVNLRACKSLDLTDSWRNSSKKPMKYNGSNSPGIGFSEPVSLKQAFRGLCISQAAEMAALKRFSMPISSPRMSEVGKVSNLFSRVESGTYRVEVSLVPEECTIPLSESSVFGDRILKATKTLPKIESSNRSSNNSPRSLTAFPIQSVQTSPLSKHDSDSVLSVSKSSENVVKQHKKAAAFPCKDSSTNSKDGNRETPKIKRKPKLQNISSLSSVKNRDGKLGRNTFRTVKPSIRNRTLVIKKSKKAAVSDDRDFKTSSNGNQLFCEKCHNDSKHVLSVTNSKTYEKGDISQSSKSSICDFSSSTSLSEDSSNLSGSSCGIRPHMSKDVRWEAIDHVKNRHGFIGLSHFNLLKKLGSGDIGTVYLAELIGTDCLFAIKVMDNEFLARRKKTQRAQTEREILKMLDHPFLPTLFAQFTSVNLSCLLMEFCPGGDLHVLRQKQPGGCFPEQAARFYVAEVLLALEYLHMLGIIYRDLKPENILVREDGHIMLTDFDLSLRCSVYPTLLKSSVLLMEPPRISGPCTGSSCIDPFCTVPSCFSPRLLRARKLKTRSAIQARVLPQLVAEPTEARSNSFVGTHEYLAPEIIKGEGHGSAVDWWTLGVFLYELLYGKAPFKGEGNKETLTNVVLQNLRFPDNPIVSFQARDLIRGLLAKDPENRLGMETGAAEIKRHSFFEGINWALIRCVVPPIIPDHLDTKNSQLGFGQF